MTRAASSSVSVQWLDPDSGPVRARRRTVHVRAARYPRGHAAADLFSVPAGFQKITHRSQPAAIPP